jgi:hypothetical protein
MNDKSIKITCPTVKNAIKHPAGYRVVYDNLLGWLLEEYEGNASLLITEKHALWLIKYWQRNPYFI